MLGLFDVSDGETFAVNKTLKGPDFRIFAMCVSKSISYLLFGRHLWLAFGNEAKSNVLL